MNRNRLNGVVDARTLAPQRVRCPQKWQTWLAGLLLVLATCTGRAQWLTQTNVIVPGWSAIYLYVDPSSQTNLIPITSGLPLSLGNPIDQIWLWKVPSSTAQYLNDPQSPFSGGGQWLTWAMNATNTANTLGTLIPNTAYLVHSTASTNFNWTVKGQPAAPSYTWDITGLNFIGFPTPYVNPPVFQNYFAQDPAIASVAQYFFYNGGPFGVLNPQQVLSPALTRVTRGTAYWVSATNVNNTYFGPFKLTTPSGSGITFGTAAGQETIHLINVTTNTLTIYAQLCPSETPPAGQTNIVGAPPLVLEGALNSSNLTYNYSAMGVGVMNSWTLPPFGTPGCDIPVVIGVNRFALTNTAGSLYAGFLRFTDSLGFSDVDVPVSAISANNAGLWVGHASITQVGSYLKSYATNLDGTYAYTIATNFQYGLAPATPVTTNYLVLNQLQTNTTVTSYVTNLLTVNSYTTYGSVVGTNAFVLTTNLVVNETVAINATIQTNFTGFSGMGYTTTNSTSTQVVVTAVSALPATVTNRLPLISYLPIVPSFALATNLQMSSVPTETIAADVNNDGYPDIITANNTGNASQALSVYLNQRNGTFGTRTDYPAGSSTISVAVADVNNDGQPDLIGANNGNNSLSLLTNNGAGGFASYKTISLANAPNYVTAASLVTSGRSDLIVMEQSPNFTFTVVVLTNNGSGGFSQSASLPGTGQPAFADVNNDGRLDLIVADPGGNSVDVYTNAGQGQFVLAASPATSYPYYIQAADVNHDHWIDLIVASPGGGNPIVVFTNNAGQGFVQCSTNSFGSAGDYLRGMAAADMNSDGYADIVCYDDAAKAQIVMTNNGAGFFAQATVITNLGNAGPAALADINNDGRTDMLTPSSGYYVYYVSVYTNFPGAYLPPFIPSFSLATNLQAPTVPPEILAVDVNNDGYPDIITANNAGSGYQALSVYLNQHNGTFGARADYTASNYAGSVAVADVNNDGQPDLIGANNGNNSLSLLTNNGAGGFASYKTISLANAPNYVTAASLVTSVVSHKRLK